MNVMRPDAEESRRLGDSLFGAKAAVPVKGFHAAVRIHSRTRKILTACKLCHFARRRAPENFLFGPKRSHSPARKHQQLIAEAIRFLDVVRHEECGTPIARKCFLKLRLDLTSQMSVESRERLIEQKRLRVDREGTG